MKRKLNKKLLNVTALVFACATCLSSCDTLAFFNSASQENLPPTSETTSEIIDTTLGKSGLINSLSKWNYYAAKKTIADYGTTPTSYAFSDNSALATPISNVYYDDSADAEHTEEETSKEETQSAETNRPQDTDDVRYYDLCDFGELTIERTVYFQMELTDENGFLTRHLGVGTVEVAVALGDYLADLSMITFRNGDKFYSCMYHGYCGINEKTNAEIYAFAAYRYIDGFYYVKNLQYEHYEFYLEVGATDVDFYCKYQHTGEEDEQVKVLKGTNYCIDQKVTYTIEELEAYFNGESVEKAPETESTLV